MDFSEINIGDIAIFEKSYDLTDFKNFSTLSNDFNPLHHEQKYALESGFKSPIVPVHLVSLPLSRIAGMIFPGESSLYLNNSFEAINPVFYNDSLTYSAKVIRKSNSNKTLDISVICFNNTQKNISLKAKLTTLARHEKNSFFDKGDIKYISSNQKKSVLIIGASSVIATSFCLALAKSGYKIALVYRKKNNDFANLLNKLDQFKFPYDLFQTDLQDDLKLKKTSEDILNWNKSNYIESIYHFASPEIKSNLSTHLDIGFNALREITNKLIPSLLKMHSSSIIFMSSIAVERSQGEDWDNYILAKSISDKFLHRLSMDYGKFGLKCISIMPSMVKTPLVKDFKQPKNLLSPGKIVDEYISFIKSSNASGFLIIDNLSTIFRPYGLFNYKKEEDKVVKNKAINNLNSEKNYLENKNISSNNFEAKDFDLEGELLNIFVEIFNVDRSLNLNSIDIANINAWDSLGHFSLISAIEDKFSINFESNEIEECISFKIIKSKIQKKLD